MIGLDTNIVVRYIWQDHASQSSKATKLIEGLSAENPGYLPLIVVVELVWVLSGRYGVAKSGIMKVLETLLRIDHLYVEQSDLVWAALRIFDGSNADFADCLIERNCHFADCSYTATFDEKAAKTAGMKLLK